MPAVKAAGVSRHWPQIDEVSFVAGMRLLFWLGRVPNGFSNFKTENSWGLAWQVGADYMLTDNVMINAQVRYIDIDTRATVENDAVAPGTRARVTVDVDPFIYMVGLGYKF